MGRLRRRLAGLALAPLLLLATGCGERSEPTGATAPLYPVTIGVPTGPPVVASRPARRIVALTPGAAEIVTGLGAAKQLVGTPRGTGGTRRVVDRDGGVLGARIVALHPDLIVTGSSLAPGRVARVARSAEAPLYTQPDGSVADVERAITELGLLTGRPIAARRLNAAIEADRRTVARRLRGVRPVRVFLDTGFFITVSDHTLAGDLLRGAGGRNVAGGSPEPGPFDLRELVHLDPQVYVATSDSETTLHNLRSNKATRKLAAIRDGRFAIVDTNLLDPGPQVGKGLLVLARALHPDAFR